jgi:hypothetical protein
LVTIMGTTYLTADHAVVAHNLPWGVTGPSPLTTAVQKSMSLDIHQYPDQSDLENAANQAKIYGGFVPQTNTLILSVAASLRAPSVMSAAYEKAAKQAGVKLQAKQINTLPSQDPRGSFPASPCSCCYWLATSAPRSRCSAPRRRQRTTESWRCSATR